MRRSWRELRPLQAQRVKHLIPLLARFATKTGEGEHDFSAEVKDNRA